MPADYVVLEVQFGHFATCTIPLSGFDFMVLLHRFRTHKNCLVCVGSHCTVLDFPIKASAA